MKKSKYCINASPVHVSDSMSGKMNGVPSISTSCLDNPICRARMKDPNSICAHCFAAATLKRYTAAGRAMSANYALLTGRLLETDELPIFANVAIVRIESFGDVGNVTQARNYVRIIKANPAVTFAWWTKNHGIVSAAFKQEGGKPENVVMIESSPYLNTVKPLSPDMDKTFTVYDKVAAAGIEINCGARSCAACRRCYNKSTEATVNELLK